MNQSTSINVKLIDSLAQIILSLTEEERQLLEQKIQLVNAESLHHKREVLQRDIALGVKQLETGDYADYQDSSLPRLLETIQARGKQRLEQEQAE